MVMRAVVEEAGDRGVDTTDGVRVVEDDGSWALVLPDPSEPVTHVWAEAAADDAATEALERWVAVVERADR
jgi:mannose-1-phosphate guanylyltransferase/phosphomannomutase